MIRVLEFADVINRFDFIETIVTHADRGEFEVSVCVRTEEHNIAEPEFPDGTRYRLLPGNSRGDVLQTAWKLRRILREWEIDILHAHHFDQGVIGWLATRGTKTRLVIGRHYSDAIYRSGNAWKRRLLLAFEERMNRAAKRIIVPSTMIYNILTERQGVPKEKIDIVPYGFVAEKYSPPTVLEIEQVREEFAMEGRFVIANLSRLHEEKGHRFLVEAVRIAKEKVPNILAVIVGDGPEEDSLRRQIEHAGVAENIVFAGWRRDAMTIMAAADVVAQSTLQEAFSQVMCEAMWLGKPLVMSDVSGATDIIRDGENGFLVKRGDATELAAAIVRLGTDESLRRRIGESGRGFIGTNYRIDDRIKEYEASFRKAMYN